MNFIFFIINHYKTLGIKICLCTLGKNENKYIIEFVKHYKKYGVDKIFIYDNNDKNGEKFEDKLINYIKKGFVEIKNWRGIEKAQFRIMNDCYKANFNNYDWLIFYDIDEFIYLKHFENLKVFLAQSKFKNCEKVQLNWIHRIDNGNSFFYEDKPLHIRFKMKESNILKNNFYPQIKSILKGHIPNISIGCLHNLASGLKSCDGFGLKSNITGIKTMRPDYENNYINHYYGKSLEEFVEKIKRGSAAIGKTNISILAKITRYFEIYIIKVFIKFYKLTIFLILKKRNKLFWKTILIFFFLILFALYIFFIDQKYDNINLVYKLTNIQLYQILFEKKIEEEFGEKNRVNLNELESKIPFGRKSKILNNYSNEINVGLSLDKKFVLKAIITTASVIYSQLPSTYLRLHFSVVQDFKPKDMIKIYSLRDTIREDVEFNFYNASKVEKELNSINYILKKFLIIIYND